MDFGPTSLTPLAYFDPDTSSWRTSQPSLFEDLTESPPTWPRSGMTSGGRAYALPTWVRPIDETAGSDTPLLKTPTAQLAVNGGSQHPDKRKAGGHGPTLADEVEHLLPTPMSADAERTSTTFAGGNPTLIGALLPTPTATEYGNNQSPSPGAAVRPSLSSLARTWTGDSSDPPSDSGNCCSDELHQHRPNQGVSGIRS